MSAFSYESEGGPASLTAEIAAALARALRYDSARWLVYPRSLTIAQPAVGVDWSTVVPSGVSWLIIGIKGVLTTSAVVAGRQPALVIGDGTTAGVSIPSPGNQAASNAFTHSWVRGVSSVSTGAGTGFGAGGLPLAPTPPNSLIQAVTPSLQAADQWSALALNVIQLRERTPAELARYMADVEAGAHDELFPGFPVGF